MLQPKRITANHFYKAVQLDQLKEGECIVITKGHGSIYALSGSMIAVDLKGFCYTTIYKIEKNAFHYLVYTHEGTIELFSFIDTAILVTEKELTAA